MSSLKEIFFLNRLRSLQYLCSETDPNCPKALLFIPGPDGRNNASSVQLLKYLFKGSVGKDLFDDALETELEALEDMVVLIKENSVSLMYSEPMKKLVWPFVSTIPRLLEFTYSAEEDADIDKFQLRKCMNFKRMILEALSPDDGVGIPVPVAYDDIMEIEGWPMLQAFALESILAPTGFFTARHTVVDITTQLQTLFRSVDSYYVDNALETIHSVVLPHVHEMFLQLDTPTATQRETLTLVDALGPLDVLFDFCELNATLTPDPYTRPLFLCDAQTTLIGRENVSMHALPESDKALIGKALYGVVEACEPATGMRWCRSLFFRCGSEQRIFPEIQRIRGVLYGEDALISSSSRRRGRRGGSDSDSDSEDEGKGESLPRAAQCVVDEEAVAVVVRLQRLYVQLWLTLRAVVCEVFLSHHDVLDAGTEIQQRLIDIFSGSRARPYKTTEWVSLLPQEKLHIHMDCMNALGETVSVDDVDELGGACWMYIRASVQGVALLGRAQGAVCVGDTFLFSPLATTSHNLLSQHAHTKPRSTEKLDVWRVQQRDCVCVTQSIPYMTVCVGGAVEDEYRRLVQYCASHSATVSPLCVGRSLSQTVSVPLLFSHPYVPHSVASQVSLFSEGFVCEGLAGLSLPPLCVSLSQHVCGVLCVDLRDAARHALSLCRSRSASERETERERERESVPDGMLLVFSLSDTERESPLRRVLPLCDSVESAQPTQQCVALCVLRDAPHSAPLSLAYSTHWRSALRSLDVRVAPPQTAPHELSLSLCESLLLWLDHSLGESERESEAETGRNGSMRCEEVVLCACDPSTSSEVLGEGERRMRCTHALSDAQRLSVLDFESLLFPETERDTERDRESDSQRDTPQEVQVAVVAGVAASGVESLAATLCAQTRAVCDAHNALSQRDTQRDTERGASTANTTEGVEEEEEVLYITTEEVRLDFSQWGAHNAVTQQGSSSHNALSQHASFVRHAVESKLRVALSHHTTRSHKNNTSHTGRRCRVRERLVLLCVCVVSAHCEQDWHALLSLISNVTGARVAHITVVASPSQLFPAITGTPSADDDACVGAERVGCVGREMLRGSCCDLVVAVDTHTQTQSRFDALRRYVERVNSHAPLLRVPHTALSHCEEVVQHILPALTHGSADCERALSERECEALCVGIPTAQQLCLLGSDATAESLVWRQRASPEAHTALCVLRESPATLSLRTETWSLSCVLALCAWLFPKATHTLPVVTQRWDTLGAGGETTQVPGVSSVWQCAVRKVLAQRHATALRTQLERCMSALSDKDVCALRAGLHSVHGSLFTRHEALSHNTHNGAAPHSAATQRSAVRDTLYLVIEAHRGCVIVRERCEADEDAHNAPSQSHLTLSGCLSPHTTRLLHTLLSACERVSLTAPPSLSAHTLLVSEGDAWLRRVQEMPRYSVARRALPRESDCLFDGRGFVDHRGTPLAVRPDAEQLLSEWVSEENEKRERYRACVERLYE